MKLTKRIIIACFVFTYIIIVSIDYYFEIQIQNYEEQVVDLENTINELFVEGSLELSREKAINDFDLKLNNNVYYLEDENNES